MDHPVLCENSAEVGSVDNWRIDAVGGGRVPPETRPIDALRSPILEPREPLGHPFAIDPLPPPLAFVCLLFSGWVKLALARAIGGAADNLGRSLKVQ